MMTMNLVKDLVKTEVDKLVGEKVWNWSRAILVLPPVLLGELRHLLCRPLSSCKADLIAALIWTSDFTLVLLSSRSDFQQIGFSKVSSHKAAAAVSDCFWGRQRNGSQEEEVSAFCCCCADFLSGRQASKGGVAPPVCACACEEGNQLRRKERRAQ